MKRAGAGLAVLLSLLLQGCAFYFLTGTTPDGTEFKGWAFVANDSKEVQLSVNAKDYNLVFGKAGTNSQAQIDGLVDAIKTAIPLGGLAP